MQRSAIAKTIERREEKTDLKYYVGDRERERRERGSQGRRLRARKVGHLPFQLFGRMASPSAPVPDTKAWHS